MALNNLPPLNLAKQLLELKKYFPESHAHITNSVLTWSDILTPTPLSASYKIRMVYTWNKTPNVYVTSPKLALAKGKKLLPHVYSTPKQHLCLYNKKSREWGKHMPLVKTIIPWASDWLQFYELWLVTGVWQGGGIEHETSTEKSNI